MKIYFYYLSNTIHINIYININLGINIHVRVRQLFDIKKIPTKTVS
jgi:hypothetical protein